jgi:ABC-type molybdate transport system permease subunit
MTRSLILLTLAAAIVVAFFAPPISAQTAPMTSRSRFPYSDSIGLVSTRPVVQCPAALATYLLQMPTLPMFEVYSQGQTSNLSIINGQSNPR